MTCLSFGHETVSSHCLRQAYKRSQYTREHSHALAPHSHLHEYTPIDMLFFNVDIEVYRLMSDNRKGLHLAVDESLPFLTWPTGRSTGRPYSD